MMHRFKPANLRLHLVSRSLLGAGAALALIALGAPVAQGVIVADGSSNTTAFDASGAFGHVGARGVGTGVYLGHGVVLTANHVGAGTITLGGVNYTAKAGSAHRIRNADNSNTDLLLYQIHGNPGLSPLALGTPAITDNVHLVGDGLDPDHDQTWYVQANTGNQPWVWSTSPTAPHNQVFTGIVADTSARTLRWGTNTVEGTPTDLGFSSDQINGTDAFYTDFSDIGASEAQAINHDSGGAVFSANDELEGIILAVGTLPQQPGWDQTGPKNTVVFNNATFSGDVTYFADLSTYQGQISRYVAAVPEPTTLALLAPFALAGLLRRRA